jgi:hypothetical protein
MSGGLQGNSGRSRIASVAVASAALALLFAVAPAGASASSLRQFAYVKASNPNAFDGFGQSTAISGDTMVVSSHQEDSVTGDQADNSGMNNGAVYVFVRTGGVWTQQAYLKASNTETGVTGADLFGYQVAISGDTIVVGAPNEDSNATGVNPGAAAEANNGAVDAGAAYVFTRSGTTWTQQAYLKASNTGTLDFFGSSVAISGDTIVVGARGESGPADAAVASGAAYVFTRSGTTWSQQGVDPLRASNPGAGDLFGVSVGISGDTIVAGADQEDSNATGVDGNQVDDCGAGVPMNCATDSGAAYVFVRSGGVWTQQAYLKASNTDTNDLFGESAAISGDTVVVGAPIEDGSVSQSGAAYVFTRSAGAWSQQARLKASNPGTGDQFGGLGGLGAPIPGGVGISGDTIVVGAGGEDSSAQGLNGDGTNNAADGSGAAYVFTRSAGTWTLQDYVKASNGGAGIGFIPGDEFGISVAVSGETIVAGADGEDSSATGVNGDQSIDALSASGAAYVFSPDADGDGVRDADDNCPNTANADQGNLDADGEGDICDADDDNDGVLDGDDRCPAGAIGPGDDIDGDGCKSSEDSDVDGDGVDNTTDNCPSASNPGQEDADKDGVGDACDSSDDSCRVPKVKRGAKLGKVKKALARNHCTLGKRSKRFSSRVKRGRVIKLKPKPGTVLAATAPVKVVLSKGPRPDKKR